MVMQIKLIVVCLHGIVNSVLNLPNGQLKCFEEFNLLKNWGLVDVWAFGLVNGSFSLPEWQAVKITFFAPWNVYRKNGGFIKNIAY